MLVTLGGCATFSEDGGLGDARRVAREQFGGDVVATRDDAGRASVATELERLLAETLSADSAVRVALLNHPGLQATYARLGIAEADLVQAGRLRNPILSVARVRASDGERASEGVVLFDFGKLITMPLALRMEERRFRAVQAEVAQELSRVALAARAAYVEAVAAAERSALTAEFTDSARLGRELAQRMVQVGNWPRLQALRHQLFHAETLSRFAMAKKAENSAREQLARALGLQTDPRALRLPAALAPAPESVVAADAFESVAMTQRYDVSAARFNVEGTARSLGLTKANRFVSLLEIGPAREREGDAPAKRGYEIELQVPLFDWGDARVAKAEAIYMQAVNNAASVVVDARSDVRESYYAYRSAYDVARHLRDEIVPLRAAIRDEQIKRYNGMLVGVFEVIADARALVDTTISALDAQRDFWLADIRM
ncbi:MAG: TolC family protein, partial [Burkholderiaceae bacterium]|nr:TolC family protein [Burkholderiaceae bacterium]